jgi:hypothetical protein
MLDNSLFVKAEMDYRAEKVKRGTAVRRRRHRKPLVRRETPEPTTTN